MESIFARYPNLCSPKSMRKVFARAPFIAFRELDSEPTFRGNKWQNKVAALLLLTTTTSGRLELSSNRAWRARTHTISASVVSKSQ